MKSIEIEGINITPDMIETIKVWQENLGDNSYIEDTINNLEDIAMVLIENWDNLMDNKKMKDYLMNLQIIKRELEVFTSEKGDCDE